MNERDILGRHFEFTKNFFETPQTYGIINLYQIGDLCCECGFEMQPHLQLCHEISYIVSGKGWFYTDGRACAVKEGDIYICSQNHDHFLKADESSTLRYVSMGFMFNERASDEKYKAVKSFYENISNPITPDKVDVIIPFLRLIDEFYGKSQYYGDMIETYLKQIVFLTYRAFQPEEIPVYMPQKTMNAVGFTVYTVIRYIEKNIFDIKDVRSISENLGYSYSYLSHLFKDKTGMTLQKYVNYKKIEKGLELLKYGNFTVTQVAVKLNYETVQSFSKAFKRTMGFSPNEYMKRYRKKNQNIQSV